MDLIGLEVYTEEGKLLGKLKEVLQPGANDVYIVENENKQQNNYPEKNDLPQHIVSIVHIFLVEPQTGSHIACKIYHHTFVSSSSKVNFSSKPPSSVVR